MKLIKSAKSFVKKVIYYFIKPQIEIRTNSYSQAGEDLIIKFLLDGVGIKNPSYLEIGVYLPDSGNNTYLFYKNGARGVCIEADITLIPAIKKVRDQDIILNIGIGTKDLEEADFYIFDEPSLNTFDKNEAEYRQNHGTYKVVRVEKVSLRSINSIISEYFSSYPHFLSIDVEGLDLDVLKTLDFESFPIPIICVETCKYSENHIKQKEPLIIEYMISKDYFVYGDTYINTIFVNKQWFHSYVKE